MAAPFFSLAEAAAIVGRSEKTIIKWIDSFLSQADIKLKGEDLYISDDGLSKLVKINRLQFKNPEIYRVLLEKAEKPANKSKFFPEDTEDVVYESLEKSVQFDNKLKEMNTLAKRLEDLDKTQAAHELRIKGMEETLNKFSEQLNKVEEQTRKVSERLQKIGLRPWLSRIFTWQGQ